MLDQYAEKVPTLDQFDRLTHSVKLPAELNSEFEQSGISPAVQGCKRRFPRLRCRGKNCLVALEHRQTLPALPREREWFSVYLTDKSRGGIGILHGEPLYPKERMRAVLADGKLAFVEVVRCERVGDRCFSIGVKFVEQLQHAAKK